ncbi:deleted in malignant brain tumors 1 protein-like [Gigantopelta aegis]|uniref:deleted in malignant brain tumors 1 protein-like n=1 Tax=Gigantopelta aegis TaxID=1735272 RepID=UPI001B889CF8|nr:deleted in malignant brain tumors 1 protein-like [Gigantopelta aegis]
MRHSMHMWILLFCLCSVVSGLDKSSVRLVNGSNDNEGRVEILHDGQWGSICDDGFNDTEVQVVCRSLGFQSVNAELYHLAQFGQSTGPIWLDNVICTGSEQNLDQCSFPGWGIHDCAHREDVGVRCQLSVRLVNGSGIRTQGRVEIKINGTWGTVCDDGFDSNDASVICAMMGFNRLGPQAMTKAAFGQGSGPVFFQNLSCTSFESSILDCLVNPSDNKDCRHNEDSGVICQTGHIDKSAIRLVNGPSEREGRVEIFHNDQWGSICDGEFNDREAGVVCRNLGLPSYGARAYHGSRFGLSTGPIWLDNVTCNGDEHRLDQCSSLPWGENNCSHSEDVSVQCSLPIRLVNGSGIPTQGRVEIQINGIWGTVCDDQFDYRDAGVVCDMMGFNRYGARAVRDADFGNGSGPIYFDDLACRGNESSITGCLGKPVGDHNCKHSQDAGVICQTTGVRLVNGATTYEGRVEILYGDRWISVCDDGFHQKEAAVICRSLSLPSHNALAYGSGHFGRSMGQISITSFNCDGYEQHLDQCYFSSWYSYICHHGNDVGISCQFGPDSVTFSPPTPGLVVEGDSLNITCVAECHPPCSYSWAPGSPHFTSRPVLTLSNINMSQTGSTYTCTAKNIGSDASRSNQFLLIVNSMPFIPSNISTRSISPTVVSITWVEEFNGGSAQMFLVQYRGDAISQWTNFTELFSERGIDTKHTILIPDLHPKTKYLLRVLAFNKYGYKNFTEEEEILTAGVADELNLLAVAVGSGSGFIILILLLVVTILVCQRRKTKEKTSEDITYDSSQPNARLQRTMQHNNPTYEHDSSTDVIVGTACDEEAPYDTLTEQGPASRCSPVDDNEEAPYDTLTVYENLK